MKLPEKRGDTAYNAYNDGWNTAIKSAEYLCKVYGIECTKKCLLNNKEYYLEREEEPYFKGWYDCIVEIERLNVGEDK